VYPLYEDLSNTKACEGIEFRKFDIDDENKIADTMGVSKVPCFLFLHKGKVNHEIVGAKVEEIIDFITIFSSAEFISSNQIIVAEDMASNFGEETDDDFTELQVPEINIILDFPLNEIDVSSCWFHKFLLVDNSLYIGFRKNILTIPQFWNSIGLGSLPIQFDSFLHLNSIVPDSISSVLSIVNTLQLDRSAIQELYEYCVPTVSIDGSCSNTRKMSKRPFNLATDAYKFKEFNDEDLQKHKCTVRLLTLKHIVDALYQLTNRAEWIGIYRLVSADGLPTLLKESYRGVFLRAILMSYHSILFTYYYPHIALTKKYVC